MLMITSSHQHQYVDFNDSQLTSHSLITHFFVVRCTDPAEASVTRWLISTEWAPKVKTSHGSLCASCCKHSESILLHFATRRLNRSPHLQDCDFENQKRSEEIEAQLNTEKIQSSSTVVTNHSYVSNHVSSSKWRPVFAVSPPSWITLWCFLCFCVQNWLVVQTFLLPIWGDDHFFLGTG